VLFARKPLAKLSSGTPIDPCLCHGNVECPASERCWAPHIKVLFTRNARPSRAKGDAEALQLCLDDAVGIVLWAGSSDGSKSGRSDPSHYKDEHGQEISQIAWKYLRPSAHASRRLLRTSPLRVCPSHFKKQSIISPTTGVGVFLTTGRNRTREG
jgi:hypothetical protein